MKKQKKKTTPSDIARYSERVLKTLSKLNPDEQAAVLKSAQEALRPFSPGGLVFSRYP